MLLTPSNWPQRSAFLARVQFWLKQHPGALAPEPCALPASFYKRIHPQGITKAVEELKAAVGHDVVAPVPPPCANGLPGEGRLLCLSVCVCQLCAPLVFALSVCTGL